MSLYGQQGYFDSQGVLLRIANIERDGYLFFDKTDDSEVRGGKRQFMLVSLAPRIGYLESLRIKEVLEEHRNLIKQDNLGDLPKYYQKTTEILTTPPHLGLDDY